jgi:hypothetical protein
MSKVRLSVACVGLAILTHFTSLHGVWIADRFLVAVGWVDASTTPSHRSHTVSGGTLLPEIPVFFVPKPGEASVTVRQPLDVVGRDVHVRRALELERRMRVMIDEGHDAVAAHEVGVYVRAALVRTHDQKSLYMFNPRVVSTNGSIECRVAGDAQSRRRHRDVRVEFENPIELERDGLAPKKNVVDLSGRFSCAFQTAFDGMNSA